MMASNKRDIITKLQQNILLWEGFSPAKAGNTKGIGLGILEAAFPNGVFPTGAIHEMICPTPEQAAASSGFLGAILGSLMHQSGICLWISTGRKLFPPSLMKFNTEPHQVIFIDVQQEKDVLWAMEEALKCKGLVAVVAEVQEISIVQSRRLQLAVESSKVTGFLIRNDPRKLGSTTCVARWQITPLPSVLENELPGVGFPHWQVELLRVRNGNPGKWELEWIDGNFVFQTEEAKEFNRSKTRIAG